MRWIIAFLTWLSAEPGAVDSHAPRAAAATQAAFATLTRDTQGAGGEAVPVTPAGPCPDGKCPPPSR